MSPFSPLFYHSFAGTLHRAGVPFVPALITYGIRFIFSCYIPYSARLGTGCSLGYGGLGIVISDQAVIGDGVEIGVGVVIGGNARQCGVPTVGDNVYIGAGAKVLGPITIGDGCVIGANSVVVKFLEPGTVVAGVPAKIVHMGIDPEEYIYHRRLKKMANEETSS
jgi:serine O-acetyltransferase